MVKLVGVFQGKKVRSVDCKARRFMPLEIEPDLTMVMALDDFCMACGPSGRKKQTADIDTFMRNYSCLDKDEVSASLMVTWEDTLGVLAQTVNCVGCRRSVETLYHSLRDCDDSALDPLIVTKEGFMSVNREHVNAPTSLANLFCYQVSRLSRVYIDAPAGKKAVAKRGGRCPSHTLDQKKIVASSGTWLDTWEAMEKECREEVVLLPFSTIRATLDKYLKKHSFCCECANMVNKAFTYLIEEGKEPARAAGEKTEEDKVAEDGTKLNEDGSVNLFTGISACTKDGHVHVDCNATFISQLLILAEPELSGLKQERHAKTIEIAQKEVLICIGITLFNRFQKIQQKLREGEQTCDLLCLVSLLTLRKSMDIAAERKRGITDLDLLCQQIEEADREKERRQARKREKKSKQQQKKKDQKVKSQAMSEINAYSKAEDSDHFSAQHSCTAHPGSHPSHAPASDPRKPSSKNKSKAEESRKKRPTKGASGHGDRCKVTGHRCKDTPEKEDTGNVSDSDSGLSSGYSEDISPLYSREEGRLDGRPWVKGGSPELGLDEHDTFHSFGGDLKRSSCLLNEVGGQLCDAPRLVDLLEADDEDEEEGGISAEEIKQFRSQLPQLNSQRQQLRENLREKFAALCGNVDRVGKKTFRN